MGMVCGQFAGAAPGPYAGSTARYHKIVSVHTHDGDVAFAPSEVEMLGAFAGTDVGGSYTSSTTSGGTVVGNVRDGNYVSLVGLAGAGGEIIVDHGSPTLVMEIWIKGPPTSPERMPSTLRFYESSDGSSWTLVREWSQTAWHPEEERYYAIADESLASFNGKWRHHRLVAQSTPNGTYFGLAELYWFVNVGDSSRVSGLDYTADLVGGFPASLVDGNWLTGASVVLATGYFDHDVGRTPVTQYGEFYFQAMAGSNSAQAPTAFTVSGSNWAGDYTTLHTYTHAAWTSGDWSRFAI